MAERFRHSGHILRFIEYMDVGATNGWRLTDVVGAAEIAQMIAAEMPLEPVNPNYVGEVAQRYRYKDGGGEIGIISSVTQPFCGTCNRTRLTADVSFRWCLLDEGEVDLRGPLRRGATDGDLSGLIEAGLGRKRAGHAAAPELVQSQRAAGPSHARSMIRIGG